MGFRQRYFSASLNSLSVISTPHSDRLIQEEVGFFFIMEEAEPLNSFRTEALGSAKSLVSFKERFLVLRGSGRLSLEQTNRGSGRKELGGEVAFGK